MVRLGAQAVLVTLFLAIGACEPAGGQAATGGAPGSAALPSSVARMPKAEIEAIVKAYLLEHPEVLSEALAEVDRYRDQKTFAAMLTSKDDPSIGPADAAITIVEFFDYNCGYCKQANPWVLKQLDSRNGDVRVIFKELPILRESSLEAAKAAIAAGQQGKYRDMHAALMRATDLSEKGIEAAAKSAGVNLARLRKDMESEATIKVLQRVAGEAEAAGINGTPAFLINGQILRGYDPGGMQALVDEARKKR